MNATEGRTLLLDNWGADVWRSMTAAVGDPANRSWNLEWSRALATNTSRPNTSPRSTTVRPGHPNGTHSSRSGRLRVVVADPEALDRAALAALVGQHPSFSVVAETGSVQETIASAHAFEPDVVLLTVTLPSVEGGPACAELLEAIPDLRIVAISERGWNRCMVLNPPSPSELPLLLHAEGCSTGTDCLHLAAAQGAKGTVRRSADPAVLFAVILDVAMGRERFEPGTQAALAQPLYPETGASRSLSVRELEVVALIAQGHSNKEISTALRISEATVKKHVGHSLRKLALFPGGHPNSPTCGHPELRHLS